MDYIICYKQCGFHLLSCRFYNIQAHDYDTLLTVFHIYATEFDDLTLNITQSKFILKGWLQENTVFVNKHQYNV